ncbi:MAG: PadR family transcriptional regulator, partial [Cryobacterium sp.]
MRTILLAVLTLGPAYGFQLHTELHARTAARRQVNAGQVYATLDRLQLQGAVQSAGVTDDGLPLYSLTPAGTIEALDWLHGTDSVVGAEWENLVDRVLLAASLPHVDALQIIAGYRIHWSTPPAGGRLTPHDGLAQDAADVFAHAALEWLSRAEDSLTAVGSAAYAHGLNPD